MKDYNCVLFFDTKFQYVIKGVVKYYINEDNICMIIYKYNSVEEGLSAIETRSIELPYKDNFEKIFNKNIKNINKAFFKDSYCEED